MPEVLPSAVLRFSGTGFLWEWDLLASGRKSTTSSPVKHCDAGSCKKGRSSTHTHTRARTHSHIMPCLAMPYHTMYHTISYHTYPTYIHTYTYIHTCKLHAYTHTYVRLIVGMPNACSMHVYMSMCSFMCGCMYVCMYVCKYVCMCVARMYACRQLQACMSV